MPCTDGGPSREQVAREAELRRNLPAALCAILTTLEFDGTLADVLRRLDYEEAGFRPEWLTDWWRDHKRADRKRRQEAQQRAQRKAEREAAIRKLSPADRKILGL